MGGLFPKKRARNLVRLADVARDRRDWAEAARCYRRSLRLRPAQPAIWVQYGHALKEAGQLVDAELAYRKALSHDRQSADAYLQLGHVLKLQGRKEEAVISYRHAVIADHEQFDARRELEALGVPHDTIQSLPKVFR